MKITLRDNIREYGPLPPEDEKEIRARAEFYWWNGGEQHHIYGYLLMGKGVLSTRIVFAMTLEPGDDLKECMAIVEDLARLKYGT